LPDAVVAALATSDFRQPDRGLDGFDLAEEGSDALPFLAAPVGQEALGRWGDAPVRRIRDRPPRFDVASDLVNEIADVVFLGVGGQFLRLGEGEGSLVRLALFLA
jgi:hypothetical protein